VDTKSRRDDLMVTFCKHEDEVVSRVDTKSRRDDLMVTFCKHEDETVSRVDTKSRRDDLMVTLLHDQRVTRYGVRTLSFTFLPLTFIPH